MKTDSNPSLANITKFESGGHPVVYATSIADIQSALFEAESDKSTIYPISTGYNWGLGSRVPISPNSKILDLSAMNQILEYDESQGIVLIEPGVTQEQLANFLETNQSQFMIDVTGSSKETSIVGNALERGITYNFQRSDRILGLEIVTGRGDRLQTGSLRFPQSKLKLSYKFGVGPDLTHLFLQSNFGVVTKMAYQLKRKSKNVCFVKVNFPTTQSLAQALPAFGNLLAENIITSIFHCANTGRAAGVLGPYLRALTKQYQINSDSNLLGWLLNEDSPDSWTATGILEGSSHKELQLRMRSLRVALGESCTIQYLTETKQTLLNLFLKIMNSKQVLILLETLDPFLKFSIGKPSNAALGAVLSEPDFKIKSPCASAVDQSPTGFIYCLPLTRLSTEPMFDMLSIINKITVKWGFSPDITLNPISAHILEAVISLSFDPTQKTEAHACVRELQTELIKSGHIPYRTNIKDMDLFFIDDVYLRYLKDLKTAFDPNHLIAPGRYLPTLTPN